VSAAATAWRAALLTRGRGAWQGPRSPRLLLGDADLEGARRRLAARELCGNREAVGALLARTRRVVDAGALRLLADAGPLRGILNRRLLARHEGDIALCWLCGDGDLRSGKRLAFGAEAGEDEDACRTPGHDGRGAHGRVGGRRRDVARQRRAGA